MPKETLTLGIGLLLIGAGATLASADYTVRKGDSLSKLAAKFHVNEELLKTANGLTAQHPLKRGMSLTIPHKKAAGTKVAKHAAHRAGGDLYTVRQGENDWVVASRAGVKLSLLHRLNPDVRWSSLQPGAKLRLPGGMGVAARTPRLHGRYAIVTGENVTVRRQQGVGAERVTNVDAGTRVVVLSRDGGWYKLRFPKGTEGWVRGDLLKAAQPPQERVAVHRVRRHESEPVVRRRRSGPVVHTERREYVATMRRASRSQRVAHWEKHVANVKARYVRIWSRRQRRFVVAPLTAGGGDLIARAETFRGVRYSWGHASRSGTDCSGFTTQVYGGAGVRLPRTSQEQSHVGQGVDRNNLTKGDLVFFHTGRGRRVTHVGIYMGSGKFIHASSGGGKVQVNRLDEGYYSNRFVTGRRIAGKARPKPAPKAEAPNAEEKPATDESGE